MAIVTQTDKRTGITYAYETQYFWDKEEHADNKISKRLNIFWRTLTYLDLVRPNLLWTEAFTLKITSLVCTANT